MKRQTKRTFFIIILFVPILSISAKEETRNENLKLSITIPAKGENIFFKTTPFIAVDDAGNVYGVDNREHIVYKFDKYGKFLLKIGKKGAGPGDLERPVHICISKNKVFISDDRAVSIFDLKGKFIDRFRKFRLTASMAVFRDAVLLAEPSTDPLISVFDFEGEIKGSFHRKYRIDYSLYKGWPRDFVDQMVNRGKILCNKNYIFYISYAFGDIFKYNSLGKMLFKKKMEHIEDHCCPNVEI